MVKDIASKINFKKLLLILLLISFCFPYFDVFHILTFNIKLYRIISLLMFFSLFFMKNVEYIPSKKIFRFLIYMILVSVVASFFLGFDRLIFDYIFAYLITVVIYNYGKELSKDELTNIFQLVAITILTLIIINIVKQKEIVMIFLKTSLGQHPDYKSYFPGGLNLDATWVAMFSIFFIKKPYRGYIYLILSFLISMILSSRAGLIINVMSLLFIIYNHFVSISKEKRKIFIIIISVISLGVVVYLFYSNIPSKIIDRFLEIGEDGGSQGRLNIWKNVLPTFILYPFGVGVGNAMKAIMTYSVRWLGEDNTHNIYFQNLLDLGFAGLAYLLYLIASFIKNNKKNILKNSFAAFFIIYFIIGLIQFKGAEVFVFSVLPIYLVLSKRGDLNE